MRVDRLSEPQVAPWLGILDVAERARAARFVFPRHRVQFVASHALTRVVLGKVAGVDPSALSFQVGEHGKPLACVAGSRAAVSFNMSHADGVVGVAAMAQPGRTIGFDIEPINRQVCLSIADEYFRPEEIEWLRSLPSAAKSLGFLRLWTLKEAFIKATGRGLSQELDAFWFEVFPPRIRFTPALPEHTEDWRFDQRLIGGMSVAAVGLCCAPGQAVETEWSVVEPDFLEQAHRSAERSRRT